MTLSIAHQADRDNYILVEAETRGINRRLIFVGYDDDRFMASIDIVQFLSVIGVDGALYYFTMMVFGSSYDGL